VRETNSALIAESLQDPKQGGPFDALDASAKRIFVFEVTIVGGDPLGAVEFGFFIIIIGLIYTLNPRTLTEFISWLESMADLGSLIRPPSILVNSAMMFFAFLGGSNILIATIRMYMDKIPRRILQDVLSGIALLVFSYLIRLYGNQSIAWMTVLSLEAILVGGLVITYTFLRNQF
jgi:hypothetical protein